MKKIALALAFIGSFSLNASSQITIQYYDLNPQVNNSFVLVTCDTNVSQMAGGPGRVWDFTAGAGLTEISTDTVTAISPSAAPKISMFPGTNIATKSSSPTDTAIVYYATNASSYSSNGYYSNINEYATFTNPMDIVRYPIRYGNSFSDVFSGTVHYNYLGTPITAGQNGVVNVTCDGWGKLILPTGTYDSVLRVHSQQIISDSASIFGLPFFIKINVHTYSWYIKNYHNALLSIATGDDTSGVYHWKSVVYGKVYVRASVDDKAKDVDFSIYPNPTNGVLNINVANVTGTLHKIELMDVSGKLVTEIPFTSQKLVSYNTSHLSKGTYFVRIQAGNNSSTQQITIE